MGSGRSGKMEGVMGDAEMEKKQRQKRKRMKTGKEQLVRIKQ